MHLLLQSILDSTDLPKGNCVHAALDVEGVTAASLFCSQ